MNNYEYTVQNMINVLYFLCFFLENKMNPLCKVCGDPAAGYHFGAFTCEGCKVRCRPFVFEFDWMNCKQIIYCGYVYIKVWLL